MTERQNFFIPLSVWECLMKSCGLRRGELERLRVGDITQDEDEQIWLHLAGSEESPERNVPVFMGFDWVIVDILAQKILSTFEEAVPFQEAMKRRSPDELLVSSVPPDLDIERGRKEYARWMSFSTIKSLGMIHSLKTFHEVGEQIRLALG
nr:hypothetical protein [Ktedonobacteraceae bacterium]